MKLLDMGKPKINNLFSKSELDAIEHGEEGPVNFYQATRQAYDDLKAIASQVPDEDFEVIEVYLSRTNLPPIYYMLQNNRLSRDYIDEVCGGDMLALREEIPSKYLVPYPVGVVQIKSDLVLYPDLVEARLMGSSSDGRTDPRIWEYGLKPTNSSIDVCRVPHRLNPKLSLKDALQEVEDKWKIVQEVVYLSGTKNWQSERNIWKNPILPGEPRPIALTAVVSNKEELYSPYNIYFEECLEGQKEPRHLVMKKKWRWSV